MNWRKIGQICTISYISLYLAAMTMPRKLTYDEFSSDHANFIKRAFRQILYYGGPLEPVANFFVLIPVFAIILRLIGKSRTVLALAICVSLSAAAESLQQVIPGRVSSLRDFALNSAGAFAAFQLYEFFGNQKRNL